MQYSRCTGSQSNAGQLQMIHFRCSFLTESPRWLLTKNREKDAYRILFNKECDMEYSLKESPKAKEADPNVIQSYIYTIFFLCVANAKICWISIETQ